MGELVAEPAALPQKLLAAYLAGVHIIAAGVQEFVALEAAVLGEGLEAEFALERLDAGVGEEVAGEVVAAGELLVARLALVHLLQVHHLVFPHEAPRGERLVARIAHVDLAFRMRQLVYGHRLHARKRSAANLALVRFLSGVNKHVILEVHLLGETLVAFRTTEWFDSVVYELVGFQIAFLGKCFATRGALVGTFPRVCPGMHLQQVGIAERLATCLAIQLLLQLFLRPLWRSRRLYKHKRL